VFLISAKDLRTTSNGALYIHCVLADKTGQLTGPGLAGDRADLFEQMPEGGFMRFKGRVENYKGSLQFIVDGMRPVRPQERGTSPISFPTPRKTSGRCLPA
jgi:23S rRNA maturation-related 3'-5' exoribonuclease YhaM